MRDYNPRATMEAVIPVSNVKIGKWYKVPDNNGFKIYGGEPANYDNGKGMAKCEIRNLRRTFNGDIAYKEFMVKEFLDAKLEIVKM